LQSEVRKGAKRYLNIFGTLLRNRRGAVGLFIISFFVILAVGAPLFTPYNPVLSRDLAPNFAEPSWYSLFRPGLFTTFAPVQNPGFSSASSLSEWSFTPAQGTSLSWADSGFSNPGSAVINYQSAGTNRNQTVVFGKQFDFDKAVPRDFIISTGMRLAIPPDLDRDVQSPADDPILLSVYVYKVGGERLAVWNGSMTLRSSVVFGTVSERAVQLSYATWQRVREGYQMNFGQSAIPLHNDWFTLSPSTATGLTSTDTSMKTRFAAAHPDQYQAETADPGAIIFNGKGSYRIDYEFTFRDIYSVPLNGSVQLDDQAFVIRGNGWSLLGSDQQGRDIFAQLIYGGRVSLSVGLFSAAIAVVIGLFTGLLAGYIGGLADEAIMRFTDMLLVLPILPLLIVLVVVLGQSITNIILVLGFLGWMGFARLVRSQVVSLRERPYVEAARAVGAGRMSILTMHIMPSVMGLTYVTLATAVPGNIIAEAALSFLGLGDPFLASWGGILRDVENYQGFNKLYWALPPGIAIALVSISFILIGYALDEVLNPKLRVRR